MLGSVGGRHPDTSKALGVSGLPKVMQERFAMGKEENLPPELQTGTTNLGTSLKVHICTQGNQTQIKLPKELNGLGTR